MRFSDGSVIRKSFHAEGYRYNGEFIDFHESFGKRVMSFRRSLVESICRVPNTPPEDDPDPEPPHYSNFGRDHEEWLARRMAQSVICTCECGVKNEVRLPIEPGTWLRCGTCRRRLPITAST